MKFRREKGVIQKSEVTILVNSCDSYSDVIPVFKCAFDEYWPENKLKMVVNRESSNILSYSNSKISNVKWGERLLDILDSIETEFVLMLFDDFILESLVDEGKVFNSLAVLRDDKNGAAFYLNAASVREHIDEPEEDYRILKKFADYKVNSVPAIWRVSYLKSITSNNDNPWGWEVFGTPRTWFTSLNFYSISSQKNNIFKYDYENGGAIYRGKWVEEVVAPKIKKYNISIDLNQRGLIKKNEPIKRNFLWKLNFIANGFATLGPLMLVLLFKHLFKQNK
jgi:hypothetical protein